MSVLQLYFACTVIVATICSGNRNFEISDGRKIFESMDGSVMGTSMIFHIGGLSPVERIPGIAYATTRGTRLRLMPPTGPLEKWLDVRVAINNRPSCPSTRYSGARIRNLSVPGRGRKMFQNFTFPEDCHSLNLFIPTKGRLLLKFYNKQNSLKCWCMFLHNKPNTDKATID